MEYVPSSKEWSSRVQFAVIRGILGLLFSSTFAAVEYLAENFWWYSAAAPWSFYQSHIHYVIVRACVDQPKILDLRSDLMVSYEPLQISHLRFDLLLLTNSCDTGITSLLAVDIGEERVGRWRESLCTCQIR